MAQLFAGTSGFAYPSWKPGFYPEKLPEENYYGWLVNDKLDELKALF